MKIFGKELKFNGKRVYHENDKPTPSEIGAAASSHTHNYAGSSSAGGVANSATKLATPRTINGVSFDGTANITVTDSSKVAPTGTITANRIAVFNDTTGKVIKDSGFTIATSVPSNAKFTDTVYTHPNDANTRHVTDSEKATWNAKETTSGSQAKADTALASAKSYADAKVAELVDSSPDTLNTLNELAAALGDDPNFATTVATQIGTKADTTYVNTELAKKANSSHTHNYAGSSSAGGAANTAVKLATARTINGANFDGTANITTANWGTARTLTVGNTGKSVNGSGNISWSLNEIGAMPGSTTSAATAATAGWYRIAQTTSTDQANVTGTFTITAACSGNHSSTILMSGISYGVNPTIQQLSHTQYSATGISQARIVYHTTYSGNRAYLEVYVPTAAARTITVQLSGNAGWTLVVPSTVGSIPSGYTNKAITLASDRIVSNVTGALSGNASTATKATQDSAGQQINTTYIKGLSVSGRTITYTKGDGTTGTITTQDTDTNTTYTANTGIKLNGTTFQHTNAVTAGTAQGDASKTLTWGGTFTIPTVTYDAQGHITSKGTTTMTMPANPNSDTKVTNTLNTTTKAYITGTTSASTNTGTQIFDTGVYLDTAAGTLTATTFKGSLSGNASTATKLATARTISLGGILSGSASFDGSGNVTISAAANDITTITKSLTVTTSWIDTGITGTNLATGTYAVQMLVNDGTNTSQYSEHYSGIMSWYADTTNSTEADEILLHKAGHAANGRHTYLRTIRTGSSGRLKLQISATHAFTAASSITFKFKKLI